jgi:hypothetical protein
MSNYSNYPENMSNFDHDSNSPEYRPLRKRKDIDWEREDRIQERDWDINREKDFERF